MTQFYNWLAIFFIFKNGFQNISVNSTQRLLGIEWHIYKKEFPESSWTYWISTITRMSHCANDFQIRDKFDLPSLLSFKSIESIWIDKEANKLNWLLCSIFILVWHWHVIENDGHYLSIGGLINFLFLLLGNLNK